MVFSDTSNLLGLIQDCELLTGLGDASISGNTNRLKHFTRLMNSEYYDAISLIFKVDRLWRFDDTDKTDRPPYLTDLVAGQSDYSLTVSSGQAMGHTTLGAVLRVHGVSILDASSNKVKLTYVDPETLPVNRDEFMKTNGLPAYYWMAGNSVVIRPSPATGSVTTTNGLILDVTREADSFVSSDTTKEPGFAEPYHRILSLGASYHWCFARGAEGDISRCDRLKVKQDELKSLLLDFYANRATNAKTRIIRRPVRVI